MIEIMEVLMRAAFWLGLITIGALVTFAGILQIINHATKVEVDKINEANTDGDLPPALDDLRRW